MQATNNYEREVFNDHASLTTAIDTAEGIQAANFEGRPVGYDFGELDKRVLAYATTIHRA